ncbi:TetR family transcriptional regulator, partial [Streptomyces sp. ISL-12]|nr:TetR family transcriptional regulator [Streptomyces sp. ISL-12]
GGEGGEGGAARVLAVFDASRDWSGAYGAKGCAMVNAHAEISDPAHPAYPVIAAQKAWMLELFTRLVGELGPGEADRVGRVLMLLHEGALVAHGLGVVPDPFGDAREQARELVGVRRS